MKQRDMMITTRIWRMWKRFIYGVGFLICVALVGGLMTGCEDDNFQVHS